MKAIKQKVINQAVYAMNRSHELMEKFKNEPLTQWDDGNGIKYFPAQSRWTKAHNNFHRFYRIARYLQRQGYRNNISLIN